MIFHQGIAILRPGDEFPDPLHGPKNEPVAVGFELTPELMLAGYRRGLFAWSVNPVTWWSPDPRAIIPLDGLYVSKRLARRIRQGAFQITMDAAFEEVVQLCSYPRHRGDGVWITAEFRGAFAKLFEMGHAHSVECWEGARIVGGVFGVSIGGFFSAESMFHRATDASKIALFYLMEYLRTNGFSLFDIQLLTAHTESLGAIEVTREEYLERLREALRDKD
jgi:leucyl/phenylalanyl-tRNA--protein transferase